MSGKQWEIHAAYGGLSAGDLGRIMGDRKLNPFTQAELLASALAMPFKETGRAHYRSLIQDERGRRPYEQTQMAEGLAWLERLELERSPFDAFEVLPRYSFALDLRFELARPYLSRDDDAFYIIDNPVRKDKVFKVPFVAPTSWKGGLRSVATRGLLAAFARLLPAEPPADEAEREALLSKLWEERAQRVLIFGNEKQNDAKFLNRWLAKRLGTAEEELNQTFEAYLIGHGYRTQKVEGRQGRLFFFPTFFDKIGLEIINPHDRKRRVGVNPILFECVPAGATGNFRLLYVPYDFSSRVTPDEDSLRDQVAADLPLVAEMVRDLLTVYGFGAKSSSGFGVVDSRHVAGEVRVNLPEEGAADAERPGESLVHRLLMGDPLEHHLDDAFFVEGLFVMVPDDEVRQQPWGGKTKADYRKVKARVLELLAEQPPVPQFLARPITDLDPLSDLARELAERIGGVA
jgi:CRISPR-associated protein Cmr2